VGPLQDKIIGRDKKLGKNYIKDLGDMETGTNSSAVMQLENKSDCNEYLKSKDTEDDEESTADKDDVANRS